jgi:hypothetical protein
MKGLLWSALGGIKGGADAYKEEISKRNDFQRQQTLDDARATRQENFQLRLRGMDLKEKETDLVNQVYVAGLGQEFTTERDQKKYDWESEEKQKDRDADERRHRETLAAAAAKGGKDPDYTKAEMDLYQKIFDKIYADEATKTDDLDKAAQNAARRTRAVMDTRTSTEAPFNEREFLQHPVVQDKVEQILSLAPEKRLPYLEKQLQKGDIDQNQFFSLLKATANKPAPREKRENQGMVPGMPKIPANSPRTRDPKSLVMGAFDYDA